MNDFIFIIENANDVTESWLYHISDNTTIGSLIGTLIAIILGSFVASWQYRKQKDIDLLYEQKKDVLTKLYHLEGKFRLIYVSFEKALNSSKSSQKENISEEIKEKIKKGIDEEIENVILKTDEAIEIIEEIHSLIPFYFSEEVKKINNELYDSFRKWYADIRKNEDVMIQIENLEENRKKIKINIINLVDTIQKIKILKK